MLAMLSPTRRTLGRTFGRTMGFSLALLGVTGMFSFSQTPDKPPEGRQAQPVYTEEERPPGVAVTPVPEEIYEKFKLDRDFYKKHLDYKGYSILSSAKVSDEGLFEARYLINKLLGEREDIVKAMIRRGCRFMVMAPTEMTTDVPEQRHMKNDPKTNWDTRARGLGGKLTSCGEENLLTLPRDRYSRENILIHEFNHAVHQQGLREVDLTFAPRLQAAYRKAMDQGKWKGMYSATNAGEYWAEGVQAYFDTMRPQYVHNTREKLKTYDEDLYNLVNEVYGKKETKIHFDRWTDDRRLRLTEDVYTPMEWRYVRYDKRHPTTEPTEVKKDK